MYNKESRKNTRNARLKIFPSAVQLDKSTRLCQRTKINRSNIYFAFFIFFQSPRRIFAGPIQFFSWSVRKTRRTKKRGEKRKKRKNERGQRLRSCCIRLTRIQLVRSKQKIRSLARTRISSRARLTRLV
jgi:hypothetical protein